MQVCIFGLPKTGTTGLYGLIKNGMRNAGLDPVATFEPPGQAAFKSFFGKSNPGVNFVTKVMIRKTYFEDPALINKFSHKVMIVRDPRDRAISRFLFRALSGRRDDEAAVNEFVELLRKKEANPKSISFVKLTEEADRLKIGKSEWENIPSRMEYQIRLLKKHGFHRILYEDFVAKNYSELSNYLGLQLEGNKAKNESWLGHITRSKSNGAWRDWYTAEDVEFIRPIFKPYMDHFGYEDDWDLPAKQSIDSKTASEYVVDRYAKRKKEFSLMSLTDDKSLKSKDDFEFYLGRAGDGRNADIWLVASQYLTDGNKGEAFKWFETGQLLGSMECQKALRKMLKNGYRTDKYRTRFALDFVNNKASLVKVCLWLLRERKRLFYNCIMVVKRRDMTLRHILSRLRNI